MDAYIIYKGIGIIFICVYFNIISVYGCVHKCILNIYALMHTAVCFKNNYKIKVFYVSTYKLIYINRYTPNINIS